MKNILVVIDPDDQYLKQNAFELISYAHDEGKVMLYAATLSDELVEATTQHGVEVIFDAQEVASLKVLADSYATSIAEVVQEHDICAVLLTSSIQNTEIAARLAIKLKAGVLTQVVGLEKDLRTQHAPFAGSYRAQACAKSPVAIIVAKKNSYEISQAKAQTTPEIITLKKPELKNSVTRIINTEDKQKSGRPELTEADIVVAGGHGTGGDFSALEELADTLGAAIGSTRAATDEGWISHDTQIGQTGVTVSPKLYISAGISGAIQQKSGMQTSGTIVAINSDADALVFEIADFGIVGDLHTVIPQITEEIKKRQAQ